MKIRTLIVDDEPLARRRVRQLAADEPDLEFVGECGDGADALEAIAEHAPDLVFLDVNMPGIDGLGVAAKLPRERAPIIIFTTAYDQHAVRAFEARALDYLLKPLTAERFRAAVARAREHLEQRRAGEAARGLLDLLAARQGGATAPAPANPAATAGGAKPDAGAGYLTRLTIKTDDRLVVLRAEDIDSIEAAGNYVSVHAGKDSHILRDTLANLEAQLAPEKFLRISRATIVNLDRVKELQPGFKGEHVVVLRDGRKLAMTRGLREVEQALRFG
jgi:two-component system, LytTR family, response regulator